jgi:ubiquinol-cytochrome c reductase cytochrome b subunit
MKWHEEYLRRYAELKKAGKPFFPYTVLKDVLFAIAILSLWIYLAVKHPPVLEALADPTDTHYNPRPEWYFLFLFQALKYFPGHLEALIAVVLPGAAIAGLILLPLLDRGPERHPFDRPLLTSLGVLAIAGFAALTYAGAKAPLTNPTEEVDPKVVEGRRLYDQLSCRHCHQVGGKGGRVGPALDKLKTRRSPEWIAKHFRDPQSVTPNSVMPKLNLLEDEIMGLTAYMASLAPEEPYSDQAVKLFEDNCAVCHAIKGKGGDSAPDLSSIGAARNTAFLRKYILDPTLANPQAEMPGFKDTLTEVQAEDLARFLSSLGKE